MEYKKLSNQGCSSRLIKIIAITGLVLSICTWIILFLGLYKLNNEINLLRFEQEELIHKLQTHHEFNFGYSTEQDLNDYVYDYPDNESNEDIEADDIDIEALFGGGYHTKDGLETKRLKRDIVGTTVDGIPINSESYAEAKRLNKTKNKEPYFRLRPIYTQSPTTTQQSNSQEANSAPSTRRPTIYSRRSRVMHNGGEKKYRRRFYKRPMVRSFNSNPDQQTVSPNPHRRRHRQRRVESGSRLRPTIHINGEVSQTHPNYQNYLGNGRMHHYNYHFKNWTKDIWVDNLGMDDYFQLDDGYLKFRESGLYLVYAQIYYVDEHDTNGFGVYKNDELILQCTTTAHTSHRVLKPNTCYTAGVIAFSNGDVLKIRDIEANRYSIFQKGKSFFGAVKIGEISET